jgi:hypothetical protein
MSQLFDENGMLILRQQPESPKKNVRKKYAKYNSNVQKVRECLSEYGVGDKISVSSIRKKTGILSLSQVLWILKRDGFIEWERSGSGKKSYLTILRQI